MQKWFHVHIPKTAGTSFNLMLARALGEDFQNHMLDDNDINADFGSGHRTYRIVKSLWPDRKIVAILREPKARLRSELEHHLRRADRPKYRVVGNIVRAMAGEPYMYDERTTKISFISSLIRFLLNVRNTTRELLASLVRPYMKSKKNTLAGNEDDLESQCSFIADEHLLKHPLVLRHCDNVLVRYLCSSVVAERVNESHLEEALENISKIDQIILTEDFAFGVNKFFSKLGIEMPLLLKENNRPKKQIRIFDELPSELQDYVKFDQKLYERAVRLSRRAEAANL